MDENICVMNYCIFQPITRALSIQKGSEIIKKSTRYTLEKVSENTVLCIKHNFQLKLVCPIHAVASLNITLFKGTVLQLTTDH